MLPWPWFVLLAAGCSWAATALASSVELDVSMNARTSAPTHDHHHPRNVDVDVGDPDACPSKTNACNCDWTKNGKACGADDGSVVSK